jgi:hypothetical protein
MGRKNPKGVTCHRSCCVPLGQEWCHSSFAQRRRLLKIMLKFIIENQETICRWRSRQLGCPAHSACAVTDRIRHSIHGGTFAGPLMHHHLLLRRHCSMTIWVCLSTLHCTGQAGGIAA